jgi:hypothetical protein
LFGADEHLATLARNSFDACFAHNADKRRWKAEVDGYAGAAPSPRKRRAPGRRAVRAGRQRVRAGR